MIELIRTTFEIDFTIVNGEHTVFRSYLCILTMNVMMSKQKLIWFYS